MSNDPTNPDHLSELLSAYLDGELTADEQAIVEQRLTESAEFRQLHDELRALRNSLENLLRYKLNEDLGPAVLRRAERAMLSGPSAAQLEDALSEGKVTLADRLSPKIRLQLSGRVLRWSVVAVAVAILIMVFNPRWRRDAQDVAHLRMADDAESRTADLQRNEQAEHEEVGLSSDFTDEDVSDLVVERAKSLPASAAPSEEGIAVEENTADFDDGSARYAHQRKLTELKDVRDRISGEAKKDAAKGFLPSEAGKPSSYYHTPSGGTPVVPEQPASAARGASRPQSSGSRSATSLAGGMGGGGDASKDLYFVRCDISDTAARSQVFEQLLAEQRIQLVKNTSAPASTVKSLDGVNNQVLESDDKTSSENSPLARPQPNNDTNGIEAAEDESRPSAISEQEIAGDESSLKREKAVNKPQVDAFLVEASPQQIRATLAALKSRKNQFSAVAVNGRIADQWGIQLPAFDAPTASGNRNMETKGVTAFTSPESSRPVAKGRANDARQPSRNEASSKQKSHLSKKAGVSDLNGGGTAGSLSTDVYGLGTDVSETRRHGSAQRVSVDSSQWFEALRQVGPNGRLDQDADGDSGNKRDADTNDDLGRKLAENLKENQPRVSASASDLQQEIPSDASDSAPAGSAPSSELADEVSAEPSNGTSQSSKQSATAVEQPQIRVLFLFRVVPPPKPSR